jgi:hypothetical protein
MEGNIVGEEFDEFVVDQIKIRQSNQFSGYGTSLRTDDQLKYLTNRNAWVKLASSVDILEGDIIVPLTGSTTPSGGSGAGNSGGGFPGGSSPLPGTPGSPGNTGTGFPQSPSGAIPGLTNIQVKSYKSQKLRDINIENPENYPGSKLAESAILFNSLSSFNPTTNSYSSPRAGISNNKNLWNSNFAYGLGGTDYGIQPPPGITGATVDSLNRGSIRKATVTLKAHNKFQFDIIELLYLRLGFTMMLEWGWDKYLDNETGTIQQVGNTIIEEKWFTSKGISQIKMLSYIQDKRRDYDGNYDGFFGKVSNFTWNFNPDGSYDISIDLITLGDVIESLKVNTFAKAQTIGSGTGEEVILKTDKTLKDTNILKAATLNSIGRYLYLKIEEISKSGITLASGMRVLEDPIDQAYLYAMISPLPDSSVGNQYYVKLGEFLARLETLIVPQIQNGPNPSQSQITISNTLDGNIISYFPNQVSLDPNVCIFRPFLNMYGDITGVTYPPTLTQLDQYVGYTKNFEAFGLLMNLYINFDFISKLLLANGGPDQELSLFKFMQDLCNGINSALGGVNKLETIIKDDYIVTIIDQTFFLKKPVTVELEVYGYNPKDQTSNFVKDIKFVSKITPQLASMVSIGATAAGSNTSEIDGTAFSKWSEGLVDRFTEKILEPDGLSKLNTPSSINETTLRQEYDSFPDAINSRERTLMRIFDTGRWARLKKSGALYLKRINNPYYSQINGDVMDFDKFFSSAIDEINKKRSQGEYLPGDILNLTNENYAVWLVSAFGGALNDIKIAYPIAANTIQVIPFSVPNPLLPNPRYLEYNDTFSQQGIGCYQNYLNTLNNSRYTTTNVPSSEVGFIPLSFELVLDGISGIKKYQKLNINNTFLPSNYPASLNFIITKVNHNISNNSWDTSLSTISIPKTEPYKTNQILIPFSSGSASGSGNTGGTGNVSNNITGTLTAQQGQSGKFEPLKSIAAKYESGGKGYGASNTGTVQGCQFSNVTNVENMEFGELRRRMQLPSSPCDRNRVFAVGKYQIIPLTLFGGDNLTDGLWKQLGLKDTDKYTPDIQERMFIQMLLNRTSLGNYLTAKNQGTLTQLSDAIQQLSQLFASMPTIKDQNGNIVGNVELGTGNAPYYSGALNNKPKAVSVRQMAKIMIQTRINYSGAVPNYIPSYYTSPV